MYTYLKQGTVPTSKTERDKLISESNYYVLLDDVLYHFYQQRSKKVAEVQPILKQLAVPRCLREDVLRSYHDCLAGGCHLGLDRTYKAIQLKYFWPGMYQNVADYIRSCDACQHAKKSTNPTRAPLVNMPVEDTFSRLHMDILGPLTTSDEGYKYILLVVDSFSKFPEAFPLKTQESKEIANVLFSEIFSRYGAPRVIVSDRGQNFLSKLVTAVCEIFQVTRHYTSAYHPQTNATCERMNSTIAQCLRTYINPEQTNWPKLLPGILMALRMSPSTQSSDLSPYHLVFGKEMNLPFDASLIPRDGLNKDAKSHVSDLMSHLKVVKDIARKNIKKAQERQKKQYDRKTNTKDFHIGQFVMLHTTRVPKGLSPKLQNPWEGPFYIVDKGPNNTYKIRRASNHKELKSFIHVNRLKPYNCPSNRPSLDPPPRDQPITDTHLPPSQQDGPDQNSPHNSTSDTQTPTNQTSTIRYDKGKKLFRVKWVGHSERTWEPEENLPASMVRHFHITKTQRGTARTPGFRNTFFVMCLLSVLCFASTSEVSMVQRLNYGILFEPVNQLYLGQEYWAHTFEIPLPKKVYYHHSLICNAPQCKHKQHILSTLNSLRMETEANVNATVREIHSLIPRTRFLEPKTYIGSSRSRRGLFDFIGDISKSLFGTATSDDVNTLKRHMEILNKNNKKVVKAMAMQEKHLSSFISTVNHRFDNVMSAVHENHKDTVALTSLLHTSIDALEHEMIILEELILKQTNASSQLKLSLEHLKLGIHDLVKGKLSPFLITTNAIKSSIRQVQTIINEKFPHFHIIHKDPLYYFSYGDFLFSRSRSKLYLLLKIPISPFLKPLTVYNIYSFPVPINSTSKHATQLMDLPT
ncbi:hypothetical protein FSP39_008811 [Pinctada imbricata]|uniref:Uncharacterized protein n=1 Tax=Pinctada imbricata TaxID=66713 RepID=A0AA88Y3E0_PINIB|nr:hypothetical protein FSP39_008811 [Pinctada imbricata]